MTTQIKTATVSPSAQTDLMIQMVLDSWAVHNRRVTDFFSKYADELYQHEVAPGRNRAIYLLGHLIAINDGMLPLFGLGEKLFPELEGIFTVPDRTVDDIPPIAILRKYWEELNTTLATHFSRMGIHDWLGRHNAVSPEDFMASPTRNKLNVLIGRTSHQNYHLGQLGLLVPKV
jgi:hypothetical protein